MKGDRDDSPSRPNHNVQPEELPPPPYSESEIIDNELNQALGLSDDGRVEVNLNSRLCRGLSVLVPRDRPREPQPVAPDAPAYSETGAESIQLNIVIQVVGSRGDVQPFIALGCELKKHGHTIRLATHDCFSDFVRKSGLDFFPIGGDPSELMAYMVKNPGLFPSMNSLKAGDIQKKRIMVAEMLNGCWRSCIEPDPVSGRPFVAEAIIANPPSFAHIHCAQALKIPVHLMFTMPWTSTKRFCHPLANIVGQMKSKSPQATANYISYLAVELMTWQGLGDIVNAWRHTLDLEPVPFTEGPLLAETLKVPFTYCWSPALVPKPADWLDHIDVCGFFFRDAPKYDPEPELAKFLSSGPAPVYIGFGSIVINNPQKLTATILEAVRNTGARAIVSKGWSKLGSDLTLQSEDVLFIGDCPHEWLFQHVAAVIHHGGAGTTACGLLNGRPTTIVPFFGDQPFWGNMVAAAGAGPKPIPQRQVNTQNLSEAIRFCLTPEASEAAMGLAERMAAESGVRRAVASFHANLPLATMRCDVYPNRAACWTLKRGKKTLKLSKAAAGVIVKNSDVEWSDMKQYGSKPFEIELRRWDPVTALLSSLIGTGVGLAHSGVETVANPVQVYAQSSTPKACSAGNTPRSGSPVRDDSSSLYGRSAALDFPPSSASITSKDPSTSKMKNFGKAAAGSAKGIGGILSGFAKGMYLDMPMAVAEGMRYAPQLYGGEVYKPGPITDWKSGGIVAGKNFVHGITEGFGGVVRNPIREGEKHGAAGVAKGLGVGILNVLTKVSSGGIGLISYTGQGLYKSIYSATHRTTRNLIKLSSVAESIQAATFETADGKVVDVMGKYEELLVAVPSVRTDVRAQEDDSTTDLPDPESESAPGHSNSRKEVLSVQDKFQGT